MSTGRGERIAPEGGKKQAIMEAALAVISEKGYHPATVDEIAERAGVGKGTIYVYFKSKVALVSELIDSITRAHLAEMERRVSRVKSAKEKLLYLAGAEFDFWRRHGPLMQILGSSESMGMAPELREQMRAARQGYVKLIQAVIEEGQRQGAFVSTIDPSLAATIIFGARMAIVQFASERAQGGAPLEQQADEIRRQAVDFFLRALGVPAALL